MREPPAIDAFGGGGFRLGETRFEGSLLILQDEARAWPVATLAEVSRQSLLSVLEVGRAGVEFVLLGTGVVTAPPPREARLALQEAGIGLELMSTPEAVRLYNVLARDGRQVAAALIAV